MPPHEEMANREIEAARRYHRATVHSYTSVRTGAHLLDWENKPLPYKVYPEAPEVELPRALRLSERPTLEVLRSDVAADNDAPISVQALTRILVSAAGLTHQRKIGTGRYHFRAAASAGALYPCELYVASGEVEGIESSLYHFSPADLKLRELRKGDWRGTVSTAVANPAAVRQARVVVMLTATFWRSAWKYRARAYRYCFWDGGTILANLIAAATAENVPAQVITTFLDARIERLLSIDGKREGMVAIVVLGTGASPPPDRPELPMLDLESIPLSREEVVYDDIISIHAASRLESVDELSRLGRAGADSEAAGESSPPPAGITIEPLAVAHGRTLGETILRRGSTRVFAREAIRAGELATIVEASGRRIRVDFPPLVETWLIVNAVDGIAPGAYRYRPDSRSFEMLKAGDFRANAGYLCLEQPLGMDCSALVVYMADLERALSRLGNRGYRDTHLEAGIMGGRAYLAAYALGRGATGLTFYDDDTTEFFAPHAQGRSPLLMVAVGVPRSRKTGLSES